MPKPDKRCTKCRVIKSADQFRKGTREKCGFSELHSWCRTCEYAYEVAWRSKNRDKRRATFKRWYAKTGNRQRTRDNAIAYRRNNVEKVKIIDRLKANRRQRTIRGRLEHSLRQRIREALKGVRKSDSTAKLVGCSIDDFRLYIESLFTVGMSWENYGRREGQWSLDHIIPCAIFDLTNEEHQRRCFHFSNMQPMWHTENVRKGCRTTAQPAS